MENKVSAKNADLVHVDWESFKRLLQGSHFAQIKKDISGQELIVFLGLTGAGKSTCINYMLGAKLVKSKKLGGKSFISFDSSVAEANIKYAEIGSNDYRSHTLHAEIYQDAQSDLFYADAPAFSNLSSRNCTEEVYGSFGIQLAVHSAKSIKAFAIVIDWGIFDTTTATELKNLLYTLSQIFSDLESISESLVLLINKAPKDIAVCDFYETVLMFQQSQNEKKLLLERHNSPVSTVELNRLRNELRVIDFIERQCRERKQNIVFVDIFDNGESRDFFYKAVNGIQICISKRSLNFKKYNKSRDEFEEYVNSDLCLKDGKTDSTFESSQLMENESSISLQEECMEIIDELIIKPAVLNEEEMTSVALPKIEMLDALSNSSQDSQNEGCSSSTVLTLPQFINTSLKVFCVGLGFGGFVLSMIGVSAILNSSIAISIIEEIFQNMLSTSAFYAVIYGLIAIVGAFIIYKAAQLIEDVCDSSEPCLIEDNVAHKPTSDFLINDQSVVERPSLLTVPIIKSHSVVCQKSDSGFQLPGF